MRMFSYMRIKLAVLLPLVGCAAILGWAAMPPAVPPSPPEKAVIPPPEREARQHVMHTSPPVMMPLTGGPDEMFLLLDTDGDGLLSCDEMPYSLQEERNKWDLNGDGHIDLLEWNRYINAASRRAPDQDSDHSASSAGENSFGRFAYLSRRHRLARHSRSQPPRPPFNEKPSRPPTSNHVKHPKNLLAWLRSTTPMAMARLVCTSGRPRRTFRASSKSGFNHDGYIITRSWCVPVSSNEHALSANDPRSWVRGRRLLLFRADWINSRGRLGHQGLHCRLVSRGGSSTRRRVEGRRNRVRQAVHPGGAGQIRGNRAKRGFEPTLRHVSEELQY